MSFFRGQDLAALAHVIREEVNLERFPFTSLVFIAHSQHTPISVVLLGHYLLPPPQNNPLSSFKGAAQLQTTVAQHQHAEGKFFFFVSWGLVVGSLGSNRTPVRQRCLPALTEKLS